METTYNGMRKEGETTAKQKEIQELLLKELVESKELKYTEEEWKWQSETWGVIAKKVQVKGRGNREIRYEKQLGSKEEWHRGKQRM